MSELDAEHRDQLAEALRANDPEPYFPSNREDEAYYRGFADALAPLIAGWLAPARNEALEDDAAESGPPVKPAPTPPPDCMPHTAPRLT